MVQSRLKRVEDRKATKRMALAIIGSIALLVFLALFGLRILIGFSLLVDRLRGSSPQTSSQQALILPPVLDPLPEATNSATIAVTGRGTTKTDIILYVNDEEYKKQKVSDDGSFIVDNIPVEEGTVTVSAKSADDKNNISDLSNIITTVIDKTPPKLTVDSPADRAEVRDGTRKVTVTGLTDEDMKVTINGRIVVLKSDGSFTYALPVNDGENKLTIIAKDAAGNETKVERTVIYGQ